MVAHRLQQPVLVIAHQKHHLGLELELQPEHRVNAGFRIRAAVDVVAKEDHGVAGARGRPNLIENVRQRSKVAVDVADRDRRHVSARALILCQDSLCR